MEPIIIKGCPGGPDGKWGQVQAIQHQPFIFIMSNGSKWLGQEEDDIENLLEVLAKHPLDKGRFESFYDVDVCAGIENPDWDYESGPDVPRYIDGPRLYTCDGVVRFFGNFETVSHVFNIDTNHKPTIDTLMAAITKNLGSL